MMQLFFRVSLAVLVSILFLPAQVHASAPRLTEKEWTVLVFLNGHNNLDSYGTKDMLEMEKVGSTDKVNVVVQWASSAYPKTRRVYVQKSSNPAQVTSPTVEELPRVDMGDYRQLIEFVRWAAARYPAKRYFIDVWNHGSGWRKSRLDQGTKDISFDDFTGNAMSTVQLGQAMREAAAIIGHKVDLYGSDACLMSMIEVANEMADSVQVFAGSQEVEPAAGWPYDALLQRMNSAADTAPQAVGRALAEEYIRSYQGGSQGTDDVTFSVFDLGQIGALNSAIRSFGDRMKSLSGSERTAAMTAGRATQKFTYADYADLLDFVSNIEKANLGSLRGGAEIAAVRNATQSFVVTNKTTPRYSRAKGVAIWVPDSAGTMTRYMPKYRGLRFSADSGWNDALQAFIQ